MWSGADIVLRRGLQFGFSIALARMLGPDEIGKFALLLLFTAIASAFVDSGLSSALIQRQNTTHTDESTVFWFNLSAGLLLGLVLISAAPKIASFYALPVLASLISALALNVFLSALGSIHTTLLSKRLEFRVQMKIGIAANAISGIVAIVMAKQDFGVWALVIQILLATSVTTTMLWFLNSWRPSFEFNRTSARNLFGFGGYMFFATLIDTIYSRVYTILIGKLFGVGELGLYSNAEETKQIPAALLTSILARVAFPMFSMVSQDKFQLRRGVQLAIRVTMLFNMPMMLGLSALAQPIVLVIFGPAWIKSVQIMRVLCLSGALWPLHLINLNVLLAQGHSKLFFKVEVLKKTLGLGLLAIGALYGIMGIAWSQVVFSVIAFAINAHYTKRFLNYGALQQFGDFLPALVIASIISIAIFWLEPNVALQPILKLFCLTVLGGVSYFSVAWLFRFIALEELRGLFQNRTLNGT